MSRFLVEFLNGDSDIYEASDENQLYWELRLHVPEIASIREVDDGE